MSASSELNQQQPELPLLPLRDVVVFPHMVIPLFVGRPKSIKALETAMEAGKSILLVAQKSAAKDEPSAEDLYEIGCMANILQMLKLPDGTIKVLVEEKLVENSAKLGPWFMDELKKIDAKSINKVMGARVPKDTLLFFEADGIELFERSPSDLPDLFQGGRLLVFGRYVGAGEHALRLRGNVGGKSREIVFEGDFSGTQQGYEFVPALWAERRIAFLLDTIRLIGHSQELVGEVERLGKQFGIVTPYTSHLIIEEGKRVATARGEDPAQDSFFQGDGDEIRIADELRRAGTAGREFDDEDLRGKLGRARVDP